MFKLLIVEDEMFERNGLLLQVPWQRYGIDVVDTAENGIVGLRKFEAIFYDIVITDVKMPIMDGLTMALKLRDLSPNVKILFLSGYDDFIYVQKAIRLHAYDYLLKPVGDELEIKIKELTESLLEKQQRKEEGQPVCPYPVSRMLEIAQGRYIEKLTIKSISEELLYSPNYLSTLFKKEIGIGFNNYLTKVRMKQAKKLLLEDGAKVYLVAEAVGYKDQVAFIKRFKKEYGCTPAKLRSQPIRRTEYRK